MKLFFLLRLLPSNRLRTANLIWQQTKLITIIYLPHQIFLKYSRLQIKPLDKSEILYNNIYITCVTGSFKKRKYFEEYFSGLIILNHDLEIFSIKEVLNSMAEENKKIKRKNGKDKDEIVGKAFYHKNFISSLLNNKRDIIVWLPNGYNSPKYPEKSYPVLYMHDGQNIIDPKTSYAGKDWRVDETITRLVRQKKMKEIIVVGIYNTPDRLEEYSWSDKGQKYLKFIIEELKPFIDSEYKTKPGREDTAIMGSSMGGLISFYAAWHHPEVFSMAGCLSSSFYFNNDRSIKQVELYNGPKKHVKFYIDHGEDGLIRGQKMFCLLTQKGYIVGTDIDYLYVPGAEHNEKEWAARLERPLLFFFNDKK